jgi:hypothetical protein
MFVEVSVSAYSTGGSEMVAQTGKQIATTAKQNMRYDTRRFIISSSGTVTID